MAIEKSTWIVQTIKMVWLLLRQKGGSENMDTHGAQGATGSSVDVCCRNVHPVLLLTDGAGCNFTQSIILNSNDNEKARSKAGTADIPLCNDRS